MSRLAGALRVEIDPRMAPPNERYVEARWSLAGRNQERRGVTHILSVEARWSLAGRNCNAVPFATSK